MSDAYAAAGVDTRKADAGVSAIVRALATIETGRPSASVAPPGHYAAVLKVAPNLGIAIGTDSAGSKVIVAEQTGRFDTIGIDCVAMNVNDVVCIGAEPIALVDYLAVEQSDPEMLRQIAEGLARGAAEAGVEVPGGELAVLPEVVRGHPSPNGFDIVGTCFGTVALDAMVTGTERRPGDAVIGLPSSGIHSNGYTLARRALLEEAGWTLDDRPAALGGDSVADVLLEPTVIYVRAALDLLRSDIPVRALAHITGGGVMNLLRFPGTAGWEIDAPLPPQPVFAAIAEAAGVPPAEMYDVFNMGCGFVAVVPDEHADVAVAILGARHPGTARIGMVTDRAGRVELPSLGLRATREAGVTTAG
ncbi:MAG: phosphoribosylformylglycinamidine cyclo-ligase [Solirubrobacteraceae bacterium]|jgi:phosphoribosylformylglycinamidine cyclo-ligase|nr:phosphoribosylformylglycinamidine cyclo-ligase [Solirubrobacteraceae bacterium]